MNDRAFVAMSRVLVLLMLACLAWLALALFACTIHVHLFERHAHGEKVDEGITVTTRPAME